MSDSLSPDNTNPLSDEDAPQQDVTPTRGLGSHDDLGNPERGLDPTEQSLTGEPGQGTPEHAHERRLRDSGSAAPEDSGDAPPEVAGDDESLLRGGPNITKPT
jgi:hypothetical protein